MTDVFFVKNGQLRHATDVQTETELRFDGWREVAPGDVTDLELNSDPTTQALAGQAREAAGAAESSSKAEKVEPVDEPADEPEEVPVSDATATAAAAAAAAPSTQTPKPGPRSRA